MMTDRPERQKVTNGIEGVVAVTFLSVVIFTALSGGAVEGWSLRVFECAIVLLFLMWIIRVASGRQFEITIPMAAFPIAALITIGLLQSMAFTDDVGRGRSLSMDVNATRRTVMVLMLLLIAFLIAYNVFANRQRLKVLVNFLVIYGLTLAAIAITQRYWSDINLFGWSLPSLQCGGVRVSFANRNHLAGYLELLMPISLPLIVAHDISRRMRLFYGFAVAVMCTASIHTLSRGGMISLAAEVLFIGFLGVRLMRDRRSGDLEARMRGKFLRLFTPQAGAVALSVVIMTAGIISIGASPIIRRISESVREMRSADPQADVTTGRRLIWKGTLAMIAANPSFGVGLGAFQSVYPMYKQGDILNSDDSLFVVAQAHNDYLQVMAECGIAGAAIAVWFLALVFSHIRRGIKSTDRFLSLLALGCGASIFGILVHSLFDFNLQLPSHTLLFLLLLAVVSRAAANVTDEQQVTNHGISFKTGA